MFVTGRAGIPYCESIARVAKSVYATDLKSVVPHGACGFNSHPGHPHIRPCAPPQQGDTRIGTGARHPTGLPVVVGGTGSEAKECPLACEIVVVGDFTVGVCC